jgi:DNA repair protein RadC
MQARTESPKPYGNPDLDSSDVMPHFVLEALNWLDEKLRTNRIELDSPASVRSWVTGYFALQYSGPDAKFQESFHVMFLDSQNRMIRCEEMFRGSLTQVAVYPREIARKSLEYGALSVILAHNHPSGIPVPSQADKALTCQISDALKVFDIRTLDHIIVAGGTQTFSFAENGLM